MVHNKSYKPKPVPVTLDEDHQTWEQLKDKENFRWLFNKLEVALRQNLHAGPAGTAPHHPGLYISRPVYNPYGMGIGAKKFAYDPDHDYEDFINHAVIPPGHFWCEWLPGPQISIDYQLMTNRTWEVSSVWVGEHRSDENLVQFDHWTRHENNSAPHAYMLPLRFPWNGTATTNTERQLVSGFNVEMRQGKIIEVHLRHGNDPLENFPIGTTIRPVWDEEQIPDGVEFKGNLFDDMTKYGANGNLSNIRKGYIVERPKN